MRSRGRPGVFSMSEQPDWLPGYIRMLCYAGELFGNALRRENEIHAACGNRAARHRVVSGRFILGEGNPTLGFNRFQSQGAVVRGTGKNNPDGPLALVLREMPITPDA
jgi:hypothetical protein